MAGECCGGCVAVLFLSLVLVWLKNLCIHICVDIHTSAERIEYLPKTDSRSNPQ